MAASHGQSRAVRCLLMHGAHVDLTNAVRDCRRLKSITDDFVSFWPALNSSVVRCIGVHCTESSHVALSFCRALLTVDLQRCIVCGLATASLAEIVND